MNNKVLPWSIVGIIAFILFIVLAMWGCPKYGVYSKTLSGQAKLEEAKFSRQIVKEEAQAENEAAIYKYATDSIRAEGTAIAVGIINKQLTERYLRWKWVEGLHDGSSEVIYVPTEVNLPILEAGKRGK